MSDPLEKVIRPIVEGQLRGFVKEHPGVLNGVTWYKGKKHGQVATFVNSVAKRVVRDLICAENRKRIEDAFFQIWENEKSAVAFEAAADGGDVGTASDIAPVSFVPLDRASVVGAAGIRTGRPGSRSLLPQIEWGSA